MVARSEFRPPQREPDWALLPPNVPQRVRELLRLYLQKDTKKRRSDAADVRIDIEQALAEPVTSIPAASARRPRLAWTPALVRGRTVPDVSQVNVVRPDSAVEIDRNSAQSRARVIE